MKLYAIIALILFLSMLFLPLFSLLGNETVRDTVSDAASVSYAAEGLTEPTEGETPTEKAESKDTVRVLRASSGKVESVDMKSYIVCCVASEMPPTYGKEALKAQAVASYTYVLYLLGEPYSEKADITDSSSIHQAYKSKAELREKWGESYDAYIKNIEEAVGEVEGEYMTYNGKIIKSAYHAMSSGRTNSALDVWGSDVPYLQSVTSDGDRLSPKLVSTYDISETEMKNALSRCKNKGFDSITIGDCVKNSGGYVKSIDISGETFTGEELKNAFSLRSGAFDLVKDGEKYTFTCMGYGHGVGMSQNGARYMAENGSTYDEILRHYYTGIEIKS